MNRIPMPKSTAVCSADGKSYKYIIDRVIGDGATGIVYDAHYFDRDNGEHFVCLKECYPYASDIERMDDTLVWADNAERENDITVFKSAYHKLLDMQNKSNIRNSTAHTFDLLASNGTLYSIMDANVGITFDNYKPSGLADILRTILALSRVVGKYHDNGYLHLDIKPGNFLTLPETREFVILFDMDSVTVIDDIKSGKVTCIPYSKGWAAPEQMQGQINKISPATDIYSIGTVLFEKVMGRQVVNDDIGIFADWSFDGELFDGINPKIKRLLREIFRKALAACPKRRYQSAGELIGALEKAVDTAEEKQYIISDCPISSIDFVGRKDDLNSIHVMFEKGARAVFIHAFGGLGKTELAKKYAAVYSDEYDAVVFKTYTNNIKSVFNEVSFAQSVDDNNENAKTDALRKLCNISKVLFIIDNFDVDDDPDLQNLLSLNMDIIITTRNDYSQYFSAETISIYELGTMPTSELLNIFTNEYKRELSADEEADAESIITAFDNWTLLVPMIAKYIIASDTSIKDYLTTIEQDGLKSFNENTDEIRINIGGKLVKKDLMNLLRYMFDITKLADSEKETLRNLYILRYNTGLTKKLIKS